MPVTRTSTIPSARVQPLLTPSPTERLRLERQSATRNIDTLSLTSSDAETPMPSKPPSKKAHQSKTQPRPRPAKKDPIPPASEIIEISSDEDKETPLVAQSSIIADYRRQISRIREESMKHKRDFERVSKELKAIREENQRLNALQKADDQKQKIVLDVNQLSDHLDCEICTYRMWTPYILPGCGHSFCQKCLQDWFGATHAQFLASHPQLPNVNHALIETLRHIAQHPNLNALGPYVQTMLASQMPPQPKYTCPTCREPVTSRPTEAFALKALVYTIGAAAGELPPKNTSLTTNRKGKGIADKSGPWDGFFPPRTT